MLRCGWMRSIMNSIASPCGSLLDKKQAAAYLKIGIRTLDGWMSQKIIPYYKIAGKSVRFKTADLDAALEKFRVAA